jgi:hypothetical protein
MKNIIWKQPSGLLAVTFIAPETELQMEQANSVADLLGQEADLRKKRDALCTELAQDDASQDTRDAIDFIDIALSQIEFFKAVQQCHGLSSAGHAILLQKTNNSIPADWKAVAFDVDGLPTQPQETWRWKGGGIVVDVEALRDIVKAKIRIERAPMFAALDVEFQRNLETGADNKPVVARKDALRNATKLVDGMGTVEELTAVDVLQLLKDAT